MTGDFKNDPPEYFPELADLWARRARLSKDEWTRLYLLIEHVLASKPVKVESDRKLGGPEAIKHLRQSFFIDKVLLPATAPGADPNPELTRGGLRVFYRRFLFDQLDAIKRHGDRELPADDLMADPAGGNPFGWLGEAGADCECLGDIDEVDSCALQDSARKFLRAQDDWVVVYLALHFCHGRERLPMSKIHRVYRIRSYHYKARLLGIAPPRGGYADLAQFADTMLGRWLTENDITLAEDRRHIIRHAFDLLCIEAFAECDRRDLSGREERQ